MPEKSKLKVRTSLPAKNHISKWVLEYQQKITFESEYLIESKQSHFLVRTWLPIKNRIKRSILLQVES